MVAKDGQTVTAHAQFTRELYDAWCPRLTSKELEQTRGIIEGVLSNLPKKQFKPIIS